MSASILISGLALILAATSFAVNLRIGQRSAIRARKPVLVFVDEPGRAWTLCNIGNGPAVNVIVAQHHDGQWFNPVLVRPMAKDQVTELEWLGRVNVGNFGATYEDAEGRRYTATLGDEVLRTYEGQRLPEWDRRQVRKYWQVTYNPDMSRWGVQPSEFAPEAAPRV